LTYLQLNPGQGKDCQVRQQLEAPAPEALMGHGHLKKMIRPLGNSVPTSAPAMSAQNQVYSKKLYLKPTKKRNRTADPFFPPVR